MVDGYYLDKQNMIKEGGELKSKQDKILELRKILEKEVQKNYPLWVKK
jgi:hypothetical protein